MFLADTTVLFWQVLTMMYFQCNSGFYKMIDGVAMGSHLRPMVAKLYMEKFEELKIHRSS